MNTFILKICSKLIKIIIDYIMVLYIYITVLLNVLLIEESWKKAAQTFSTFIKNKKYFLSTKPAYLNDFWSIIVTLKTGVMAAKNVAWPSMELLHFKIY